MTKLTTVLLAVTLLLTTAHNTFASDDEEFCIELYRNAKGIMTARQDGVPVTVIMGLMKDKPVIYKLLSPFVIEAYSKPIYSVRDNKQQAITEFGNKAYLTCHKAMLTSQ